jgi:hypothetical protein
MSTTSRPTLRVLMFRPRFERPIRDGTKCQTVREWTKVRPGDLVSPRMWEGVPYRSKQRAIVAPSPCLSVTSVMIAVDWWENRVRAAVAGVMLDDDEVCAFVRADGFSCVSDFVGYYRERKVETFEGVLIRWAKP